MALRVRPATSRSQPARYRNSNRSSDHSGQPFEKVERDSDRDYWMTALEAKEYGMIDDVLTKARGGNAAH